MPDIAMDLYKFGISIGWAALPQYPVFGIKSLINPLDYWRFIEAPYVISHLNITPRNTVLDVGSPKMISLYAACRLNATLYATDIRDYFIERYTAYYKSYRKRLDWKVNGGGYIPEVQDGRKLGYATNFFDKVFSVSVLEHIPDSGDTSAIKEIARVLKKGGLAGITVPFANTYSETYLDCDVYERPLGEGRGNFYQRHYDQEALYKRLIKPSGLRVVDLSYYKEGGFRCENFISKLPQGLNLTVLPFQLVLAKLFLHKCTPEEIPQAMTVGVTLKKE